MIYGGLAVLTVILFEAYPVYRIVTAGYFTRSLRGQDYVVIAACFLCALAVTLYLIVTPLKTGLRQITELQI